MKTVLRVLVLGLFAVMIMATNATVSSAQSNCDDLKSNTALYEKFTTNYNSNDKAKVQIALSAAKEYVQNYGSCPQYKAQVDYLKAAPPSLEARIKQLIAAEKQAEQQKRYQTFDSSLRSKNWDSLYQVGPAILEQEPDFIDVVIVLGSVGLEEATKNPPNDKFNAQTINFAKLAIKKLNAGAKSKNYGALQYSYKNKGNALGWLNYTIGQIMFLRMGQKKQALPYFFNASNADSDTKKSPYLYGTIGEYYKSQVIALGTQRGTIDAKDEANFAKIDNLFGLEKANAERGADAFARAYSFALADKSTNEEYRKVLRDNLKLLYDFRFKKADETEDTTAKMNQFVTAVMTKPLPNPSDAITPILVKKPEDENKDAETKTTDSSANGTSRNRTVSTKKPGTR